MALLYIAVFHWRILSLMINALQIKVYVLGFKLETSNKASPFLPFSFPSSPQVYMLDICILNKVQEVEKSSTPSCIIAQGYFLDMCFYAFVFSFLSLATMRERKEKNPKQPVKQMNRKGKN